METVAKIRRRRLVEHESISEIARELRLSRNTVKRVLRGDGTAPVYRRQFNPKPKFGPFLPTLHRWLEQESQLPKRERRTGQRLFEDLRMTGYRGSIDQVRRYIKDFRRTNHSAQVYIPQSFAPGEAYQFDWSQEQVVLGGVTQSVRVAHLRLCFSRFFLVIAYPRETQEMLFDAHRRAFAFFGGPASRRARLSASCTRNRPRPTSDRGGSTRSVN
jgi:transposase